MFELILQKLMERYGDLSFDELKARMREDGLGELVDSVEEMIEQDPEFAQQVIQLSPFVPPDNPPGSTRLGELCRRRRRQRPCR